MTERKGNFIQTYTGKQFWPLDSRPEEVDINDIAHALSNSCRYTGHVIDFYSVAEHSVLIAQWLREDFFFNQEEEEQTPEITNILKWGLLHDASEAYIADIARPVKQYMPEYRKIEDGIMETMTKRFNLSPEMPGIVKLCDDRILFAERAQNLIFQPGSWTNPAYDERTIEPLEVYLECWDPKEAEREFLQAYWKIEAGCYLIEAAT